MKQRKIWGCISSIVVGFLAFGCTVIPFAPKPTLTALVTTSEETATPLKSPTGSTERTASATLAPSFTPTHAPIPTMTRAIESNCLQVQSHYSSDVLQGIQGRLIFEEFQRGRIFLYSPTSLKKEPLLNPQGSDRIVSVAISPNREWLAYSDLNSVYNIIDSQGSRMPGFILRKMPGSLVDWLDQESLIVALPSKPIEISPVLIWNIETGEQESPTNDYPDIYKGLNPPVKWGDYTFIHTVFDPTFSYVVYPTWGDIVVWDRKNQTQIAKFWSLLSHDYGSQPRWSPDGSRALISFSPMANDPELKNSAYLYTNDELFGDRDLYTVSTTGIVERLTTLSENRGSEIVKIENYNWSPNGNFIAFWLSLSERANPAFQLTVLDTRTLTLRDYCLSGSDQKAYFSLAAPIWSPDGHFLAIAATEGEQIHTVIVDMVNDTAYLVDENSKPIGWMK